MIEAGEPIRVLHVLEGLPRGGKERLVHDILRRGERSGIVASALTMGGGELHEEIVRDGLDLTYTPRRFPIDLGVVRCIRMLCQSRKIEVIHSHEPVEGVHAHFATVGTHVAHVMSVHGNLHGVKNRLAMRYLVPRLDTLVFVSSTVASSPETQSIRQLCSLESILPNGVDQTRFGKSEENLRDELGIQGGARLVGMVANFVPEKDHLTLIRAFADVLTLVPEAYLILVGRKDACRPEVYDLCIQEVSKLNIGSTVHMLGSRSDINMILHSLDVFVLSSLAETLGVAAIEAMMVGVPLVLSDIPAFVEISDGGRTALLFRRQDSADLARILTALLQNRQDADRLVRSAMPWAKARYSLDTHLFNLRTIYEHAVQKKSRTLAR